MTKEQKKEAKKRILDAGVSLFARKGYDAVGVREIAKKAKVNISMISYYFGGKVGILKEIISEFHDQYYRIVKDVDEKNLSFEQTIQLIVRTLVDFVRTNTALAMVAMNTIPLDIPEIKETKAEKVFEMFKGINGLFNRFNLDSGDAVQMIVIGPALISTIVTHFRFKPIQKDVFKFTFDDAFYEHYIETMTTLFTYGIAGLAAQTQKTKGDNNEKNS